MLRQLVYVAIKELCKMAQDVMMVTSSLTKDMNAKSDLIYRPNAIRALCKITDVKEWRFSYSLIYHQSLILGFHDAGNRTIPQAIHCRSKSGCCFCCPRLCHSFIQFKQGSCQEMGMKKENVKTHRPMKFKKH